MAPDTLQQNWIPRKRAAALFFIFFLAVQIIVPAYQLTGGRPSRFGWQMYAGAKAPSSVTLVTHDGRELTIGMHVYLGNYRSDLDLTEALPPFVCRKHAGINSVRLNFVLSPPLEFPCRR